jgi:hypothetical protein
MYSRRITLRPLSPYEKKRAEKRLKLTKRLNLLLLFVVIIGFILILLQFIGHKSKSVVTINFSDQTGTITEWRESGFVKSINNSTGTLVINEARWNELSAPQKEGVVMLLRSYYASQSGTKELKLIIKGDLSEQILVSSEVVSISSKVDHLMNK